MMTAPADILYLPILTPARIEVDRNLTRQQSPQYNWRQRIRRVNVQPRSIQGIAYGSDGRATTIDSTTGRLIDIFA